VVCCERRALQQKKKVFYYTILGGEKWAFSTDRQHQTRATDYPLWFQTRPLVRK
jgi:hypothetical protein